MYNLFLRHIRNWDGFFFMGSTYIATSKGVCIWLIYIKNTRGQFGLWQKIKSCRAVGSVRDGGYMDVWWVFGRPTGGAYLGRWMSLEHVSRARQGTLSSCHQYRFRLPDGACWSGLVSTGVQSRLTVRVSVHLWQIRPWYTTPVSPHVHGCYVSTKRVNSWSEERSPARRIGTAWAWLVYVCLHVCMYIRNV